MEVPSQASATDIYGDRKFQAAIKMITLAPELEGSHHLIEALAKQDNIVVSLGHSAADFDTGLTALKAGATALTHVFNAMNPLHHRSPGLAGLIASSESPYFSLIADGYEIFHLSNGLIYCSYVSGGGAKSVRQLLLVVLTQRMVSASIYIHQPWR